jgi:hypothetical protein
MPSQSSKNKKFNFFINLFVMGETMPTEFLSQIALAALVGAMQQVIQHYFPWRLLLRVELPRVAAYVIGTLAYLVPLSVLFALWDKTLVLVPHWAHLLAVWACVGASGAAVALVRSADWMLETAWNAREARLREKAALTGLKEAIDGKSESARN